MAKSIRSKFKKRVRTARREHHWETKGKFIADKINARLMSDNYDMKMDKVKPPNAFVNPDDPNAVFPQHKKPDIQDYRLHKIENGGYAGVGVFRKHRSATSTKSKYATIIRSIQEIERDNYFIDMRS